MNKLNIAKQTIPYLSKPLPFIIIMLLTAWLIVPDTFTQVLTIALWAIVFFCGLSGFVALIMSLLFIWFSFARIGFKLKEYKKESEMIVITAQPGEQVIVREDRPANWRVITQIQPQIEMPEFPQLPEPKIITLPDKVLLPDVLDNPDLNNIVLGIGLNELGQREIVSAPLERLVHVAVGGSSGWGKSVFLRSLAYQIALAPQLAELALIDLEAATFSPFTRSSKLRYSIADTEIDANAILLDLIDEIKKRKELFSQYEMVESLTDYNRIANDPLPYIALMIDESTALLGDKTIEANIRILALRARKYGIYGVLGGQDWKASSLDSAIKNQLSTKIQLKAQSKAQSRVLLDDSSAASIDVPGRAYAVLPGQELTQLQTPYINLSMLMKALAGLPKNEPAPIPKQEIILQPTEKQSQVIKLYEKGYQINEIAKKVYGSDGGKQRELVENTLDKFEVI